MSAIQELRDRQLGDDFVTLLYRTVLLVARSRNFPPPPETTAWDATAVQSTAHDFLTSTNATRRLTELAVRARDNDEFSRLLQAAVLNFLRERSRHTVVGRLIRRLKSVLLDSDTFATVPDGYPGAGQVTLSGDRTAAPFGGRIDDLVRAAWTVREVTVVRWSAETDREPPIADRDSILAVAHAVLSAAQASLRWDELARVVAARFGVTEQGPPAVIAVDDLDSIDRRMNELADDPSVDATTMAAARGVIAQLTSRDILVLAVAELPVREIAIRTGMRSSTAAVAKQRLLDKVRVIVAGDPAAEDIVAVAVDLARRRSPRPPGDGADTAAAPNS